MRGVILAAAVMASAAMGPTEDEGATVEHEGLVVEGGLASSAPGGRSGAGYFTITNTTDTDDRLIAVTSTAAQRVELHTHVLEDGIARMVELEDGIDVPAGESVTLEQGGMHVMFMGLDEQWGAEGGVIVTLVFERAGEFPVTLDPGRVGHTHDPHAHDHEGRGHEGHGHEGHGHGD